MIADRLRTIGLNNYSNPIGAVNQFTGTTFLLIATTV